MEQTKSRPRHSNNNGLVEAKNGAVIRKHMGHGHIGAEHVAAIAAFYQAHFNPYLNFHRPCGVPEVRTTSKGKQRRVYRWYATPWEILRQLPDLARHLRAEITAAELERIAGAKSDTQAGREMRAAKHKPGGATSMNADWEDAVKRGELAGQLPVSLRILRSSVYDSTREVSAQALPPSALFAPRKGNDQRSRLAKLEPLSRSTSKSSGR